MKRRSYNQLSQMWSWLAPRESRAWRMSYTSTDSVAWRNRSDRLNRIMSRISDAAREARA